MHRILYVRVLVRLGIDWPHASLAVLAPLAAAAVLLSHATGIGAAVQPMLVRNAWPQERRVAVEWPAELDPKTTHRLIVAGDDGPIGWFEPAEPSGDPALFEARDAVTGFETAPGHLRAWLVQPDVVAACRAAWPAAGALKTSVESVGPGGATAWLVSGTNQGIGRGDRWLLRLKGQPVAAFDVRTVAADVCFCSVVPLAAEVRLAVGDRVQLWPSPGERRSGTASSAVAYVETKDGKPRVWIAAPRGVACPPEAHVDFFSGGVYLAGGNIERGDERFWYVTLVDTATAAAVRVGDHAVIRTDEDIRRRRFVARVFNQTAEGWLISAGEIDGLATGQSGTAWRDGSVVGQVTVRRVQRSYAVVQVAQMHAGRSLEPLDEIRFDAATAGLAQRAVGVIERVVDETLFSARLTVPDPPLLTPVAVRPADAPAGPTAAGAATRRAGPDETAPGRATAGTVAVAVLLQQEGERALGFALEPSLLAPLRPGMVLVHE